jgi:hypothetical protein
MLDAITDYVRSLGSETGGTGIPSSTTTTTEEP